MVGDLLDLGVALQVGAGYVQRDVGGVQYAVQQGEVLGDDALDLLGDEDLAGVELDLIALQLHLVLDLGEVEDPCEVEGVVYVEVDPEEGLLHRLWVELMVEGDVVLLGQFAGLLGPGGVDVVDLIVLVGVHVGAVLPLLLLAEDDGDGEELAVLIE